MSLKLSRISNSLTKKKIIKKNSFEIGKSIKIHVRFCADNGRRSWITQTSLMHFEGLEAFEEHKRALPTNVSTLFIFPYFCLSLILFQLKRKDWRLKAYTVSESKKTSWHEAVIEAQMLETFPIDRRLAVFEKSITEGMYV